MFRTMVRPPDVDFDALAAQMLERAPHIIREAGMALEPRLTQMHDEATGWWDALNPEIVRTGLPDYATHLRRLAQAVVVTLSAASSVPPSRRGPDSYFASKIIVVDDALAAVADALADQYGTMGKIDG